MKGSELISVFFKYVCCRFRAVFQFLNSFVLFETLIDLKLMRLIDIFSYLFLMDRFVPFQQLSLKFMY